MPAPRAQPQSLGAHPLGELDARLGQRPQLDDAEIAALRADYAGEVSLIDELVGDLFQVVRDRGEWERTIVVFSSDHGEMNGDAGLLYKEVLLDGAVRIPLIIRDPASRRASEIVEPVELLDVGATILDLADQSESGTFGMGISMADVIRGRKETPPRTDALSEYDGEVMLATADWKIGLNAAGETYLLFDRSADESVNLAGVDDLAETQRHLELRVLRRLISTATRDRNFAPSDPSSNVVPKLLRRLLGKGRYDAARAQFTKGLSRAGRGPGGSRRSEG
jgi:choline-sulfatase